MFGYSMAIETLRHIGKYQVLEKLGKGANSTIWKVSCPEGGIYTLKRVVKKTEEDNRFFEQAQTEYEISGKIDHPYLRKSFELIKKRRWLKTQELFLLMEFVEGRTLKQSHLSEINKIIEVFVEVAGGLNALHNAGYLHADIKPKNILLVPDNGIKIIDFGQACPIGHKKRRIQGTPDYMAPEQVDRGILDQRTDIFNFGASLYWVLTNQTFPTTMPKKHDSGDLSLPQHPSQIPKPADIDPNIPTALSKLVMDCCHYTMSERPDNMREVIARLEVAKHLFQKQHDPQTIQASSLNDETIAGFSKDDTDDFDEFIESIL